RIVMYLLRYVTKGEQKDRINEIVKTQKYLEEYGYWHEYSLLLRDKFTEIDDSAKEFFINWVKQQKVDDVDDWKEWFKRAFEKDAEESDLIKYENQLRAKKLYLVRDCFSEQYTYYAKESGVDEQGLRPFSLVSKARFVDPTECSPITKEDLFKKTPEEVFEYVNNEENWNIERKPWQVNTPLEALLSAFNKVVEEKIDDYLQINLSEIMKLKPEFLTYFLRAIETSARTKEINKQSWERSIELGKCVVDKFSGSEDNTGNLMCILNIINIGFEKDPGGIDVNKKNIEAAWVVARTLVEYKYDGDLKMGEGVDPFTESINCVQGNAFKLVLRIAHRCKCNIEEYYMTSLTQRVQEVLEYIFDHARVPRIYSIYGVWFPTLLWLEKKWLGQHLDKIFDVEDPKIWDAVWGSYIVFGRLFKESFRLLVTSGKYSHAISQLNGEEKNGFRRDPNERLVEHLMIALFNGWPELDETNLLQQFHEKASAKRRGQAAGFLTTGFESLNNEPNKAINDRLQEYWENRLEAISRNPDENIDEAIAFTSWVKNSPFEPNVTFNLLSRTLELTGGKIGGRRDTAQYIEGICENARGNELIALKCLNNSMGDRRNIAISYSLYEDILKQFMDNVVQLPDDYKHVTDIRKEAIRLADAYGRMHIYDLRQHYEELTEKMK
ncbi:MAG: hypothetical protein ACYTF1_18975, partial [Planctomycetota bacterium]